MQRLMGPSLSTNVANYLHHLPCANTIRSNQAVKDGDRNTPVTNISVFLNYIKPKKTIKMMLKKAKLDTAVTGFKTKMVYAIWEAIPGRKFYVFTMGLRSALGATLYQAQYCVIGSNLSVKVYQQVGDVVLCTNGGNKTIKEQDVISVRLKDGYLLPSIVEWNMRKDYKITDITERFMCIATMVKDEETVIEDWIDYHTYQGFELFLIYDNNSNDETKKKAKHFNNTFLIDWPWPKSQSEAFLHATLLLSGKCRWTAFIDVDEYIYPSLSANASNCQLNFGHIMRRLPTLTGRRMGTVSQVSLRSKSMGPSGRIYTPSTPVFEAYLENLGWDHYLNHNRGKSVIRAGKTSHMHTRIHQFTVKGKTITLPTEVAYLYHYKFQSWEHFLQKFDKGRAGLVKNWDKTKVDKMNPSDMWKKPSGKTDTIFRDYRRALALERMI